MSSEAAAGPPSPVEHVLFRSERVEIGAFRCPADHVEFRHAGAPIGNHHVFVFPRSRVWIRHAGGNSFAADPNVVTLYNPGQDFERQRLDHAGDFCDWFAVDPETAFEAARVLDPAIEDRPERAFRFSHGPSDARTYLAQRELFQAVLHGAGHEPLAVEERVLFLLERVLRASYRAWRAGRCWPSDGVGRRGHEVARRACLVLGARLRDPIPLGEVARAVGLSRYRLCRLFRAATGTTLHAYREQLRLRAALDALTSESVDLTLLALEFGYSSHSHFTSRFRRAFGVPPSRVRGRFACGLGEWLPPIGAVRASRVLLRQLGEE